MDNQNLEQSTLQQARSEEQSNINNGNMNNNDMNNSNMNNGNNMTCQRKPEPEPVLVQSVVDNFPLFGLSSILYAIFFCFCLYDNFMSVTSVLLCIVTIGCFMLWFKVLNITSIKTRFFYIASICLLGLSNMLTSSGKLVFLNDVGILLLWFCFVLKHFYDTSKWDFTKFASAIFITMFSSVTRINYPFKSLQIFVRANQKNKNTKVHYVFLGVLISIPLLLVVGSLLVSADAVFRDFTSNITSKFFHNIRFDTIFANAILFLVGIFGSYCTLIELCKKQLSKEVTDKKTMEPVIAITFTSILSVIYLCFSLIQIFYLFIGNMTLPEGYTYAMYAREGFFQLLFVCLINLVLVLFCIKYYRDNKVLKIILTIICFCTYIMIASSTLRMLLYIQAFCLTFLRIFVLVALFVLFLCLTVVVISIYKPSIPLFSYMLTIVTICFLAFSLSKPDAVSAWYNVEYSYFNVDSDYLYGLSMDAAPALQKAGYFDEVEYDILDTCDYSYPGNMTEYAAYINNSYNKMSLRKFNLSIYRAGKILENYYN